MGSNRLRFRILSALSVCCGGLYACVPDFSSLTDGPDDGVGLDSTSGQVGTQVGGSAGSAGTNGKPAQGGRGGNSSAGGGGVSGKAGAGGTAGMAGTAGAAGAGCTDELCNGVDDDCDAVADDGCPISATWLNAIERP